MTICFNFLFIGLSQSHDQCYKFGRLTQVKSSHFFIFFLWGYLSLMTWLIGYLSNFLCFFLIDFFFNLMLQHWADWTSKFIICFSLLFMRLSRSYDPSRRLDMLTQVAFLIDLFFNFIFQHGLIENYTL